MAAYEEMLGRKPTLVELTRYVNTLQKTLNNSDWMRRDLMNSKEFKAAFAGVKETRLQNFRWGLWLSLINYEQVKSGEEDAMKLYQKLRENILNQELRAELNEEIVQFALEEAH